MNIILLLMALCCSLSVLGTTTRLVSDHMQQQTMNAEVQLEAQELLTFAQAAVNYTKGIGSNLSPATMTVSSFQADNLLPTSFPTTDPFGQAWQADFVTDPQDPNILDLVIGTSGAFTEGSSASQQSILSSRNIAIQVIQKLTQLQNSNASNQLVSGVNSGGIALGTAYQQSFYTLSGTDMPDLSAMNINVNNYTPMIFIKAPNQLGYWVFELSDYGWDAIWGQALIQPGVGDVLRYPHVWDQPAIFDEGWQASCPVVGVNLGTIPEVDDFSNNNTLYNSSGNISQSAVICIPAYKGDITNIQNGIQNNTGAQCFSSSKCYAGEEITLDQYSVPNYIATGTPLVSYGGEAYSSAPPTVNTALYAKGLFYTNYLSIAPDIDVIGDLPLSSILWGQGFRVEVDGNTYQFANLKSAILTGQGEYDASTGKQIWATGMSPWDVNLNDSQESFSVLWKIQKNPANANNITFSIPYRTTQPDPGHGCSAIPSLYSQGGAPIYQCSYSATIPTPQVN